MSLIIKPFTSNFIEQVKAFADHEIGIGYYKTHELTEIIKKSTTDEGFTTSFMLMNQSENSVKGLRLAYPPGKWSHGKGNNLRPDLWPFQLNKAGYFQSLFLSKDIQGQGWGPKLSEKTIQVFKQVGASGIVTHCWKESPNNSSYLYLKKMGFSEAIEYPNYWIDVDYVCTVDGNPCRCTAIEMYKVLV
jgi:ribosomal protein S18 acetylase RimI-like enzyme